MVQAKFCAYFLQGYANIFVLYLEIKETNTYRVDVNDNASNSDHSDISLPRLF